MKIHMFLYTDGSAGPTVPGYIGMGYHGYYYDDEAEVKRSGDVPKDGFPSKVGYLGPDNMSGYSNIEHLKVNPIGYLDGHYSDGIAIGSSNEAETQAIKIALEEVTKYMVTNDLPLKQLTILSDSQIALIIYTRVMKHIKENPDWLTLDQTKLREEIDKKYGSIAESTKQHITELIPYVYSKLKELNNPHIVFEKVAGHSGNIGNEIADMLAVTARKNSKDGNLVNNVVWNTERYWKPNITRHPFLRFRQLFFIHNTDNNIKPDSAYFTIMDYGSIDIGKRSGEPLYGMVRLNEVPTDIVDVIMSYQKTFTEYPMLVYTLDLDKFYKPEYKRFFSGLGKDALVPDKGGNLSVMSRDTMIYPIKPSGLAKRVYDKTTSLISILERAREEVNTHKNGSKGRWYFDITSRIYTASGKKNICTLASGTKDIPLKGFELDSKEHALNNKLILGIDLPDRNTLKSMESFDPKVYVMFQQDGPAAFSYYTFIFADSIGSYGIYHNLFSSLVLFNTKKGK